MFSELTDNTILSPSYSSRNGQKIKKITIHHAAGILTGAQIANIFKVPRRCASSNYAIGKDGEIVGIVPEENRAWTSGSRWNDEQAITIEVSNCTGKPDWKISEASMASLIELCADICRRYCIVPYFDGTKNASMTFHYMFQATECPGPYIKNNIKNIIAMINNELCLQQKPVEPITSDLEEDTKGTRVKVTCDCLNIRKYPDAKSQRTGKITDHGVYTIIEENNGWGKLKSGLGWIYLKYTKKI